MNILLILGIVVVVLVIAVIILLMIGGAKRRVRVTGPAFPTPVEFTVIDNCKWIVILGAGGVTLSKNKVRLRRNFDWALMRNPTIIVHEATHVVQATRLGAMYLPTYIWQAVGAGFKKPNIQLETEAYDNQTGATFVIL